MMGQMFKMFFPNREKPAISPTVTRVAPLRGSRVSLSSSTLMSVTSPALTKAAPMPAMAM